MGTVSRLSDTGKSIKVYLLGEFRILGIEGDDITPTSAKARCILTLLILSENATLSRDRITQLLWSRHAQVQARTSLRQSLRVLRRTFQNDEPELISADRNNVYLQINKLWIDSQVIIKYSNQPLAASVLSNLSGEPVLGNLNVNDPEFESWLAVQKQGLERKINNVIEAYLLLAIKKNRPDQDLIAQSLLKINACNEIAVRTLMKSHAENGNETAALLCYSTLENTLQQRLQSSPNDQTQTLYKSILNHDIKPIADVSSTLTKPKELGQFSRMLANNNKTRHFLLYRRSLLNKVKRFWIDGVLEQSLIKTVTLELKLKEKSDILYQPWKEIVLQPESEARKLPDSPHIIDIFNELGESMLILGAAGAGKTTLLLTLGKTLLKKASEDKTAPIPVVLHLSTWANHCLSLSDWLQEELEERYQMPRKLSADIIFNQGILLLLDGLDEVDANHRTQCAQAINEFQAQNDWISMAVCSRESDYQALSHPLFVSGAVVIQPITSQQLDDYLHTIGESSTGLSSVIAQDAQLKELLTTPLILNIAAIAYQDQEKKCIPVTQSTEDVKDRLFSAYTSAMLTRREATDYYLANTTQWLSWLACILDEKKQSIFYLDTIQPHWLCSNVQRWIVSTGSIIFCGLLTGLVLGLLGAFVADLMYSLALSLGFGIVGGYLASLPGYADNINPIKKMHLSWLVFRSTPALTFVISVVLAAIFGIGTGLVFEPIIGIVLGGLWLLCSLIHNSLDFERINKQQEQQTIPNEGIRQSLRYTLLGTVLGCLLGATVGGIAAGFQGAIFVGVMTGLVSSMFFGGHVCIQHYLLRYFLWRNNCAPMDYIQFLEFAVNSIFLYRVGGGYIFIHRSLAEYFTKKTTKNVAYHSHQQRNRI